jgi:hypothetical protein
MSSRPRLSALGLVLALLALAAAACSAPGVQAQPSAPEVLRQAARALQSIRTVQADVKFGPGIDFEGYGLSSATSKLRLPSDSDTTVKVKQSDFLVDVRIVSVGGHTYLKVPFSSFQEIPPDDAAEVPDVGKMLSAADGLPAILPSGRDARLDGEEEVGGDSCYKVESTYTAAQVGKLLGGLKPAGDVHATIWSGKDDNLVRRVVLDGPLVDAGKRATVQVDLHDFNAPVDIAAPTA